VFLGVDGGGTKTALCLLTGAGDLAGRAEVAGSYDPSGDPGRLTALLAEGVTAVCNQARTAPERIDYAFVALPGYGEASRLLPLLDGLPAGVLGHQRYRCDNDMVAGWAGSFGGADGINVVSGTGSIAYGRHGATSARAGGWGELFGDEGSGYWVGRCALTAFSRMSDGREPCTALYAAVRAEVAQDGVLTSDLDLLDVVLNQWSGSRSRIARLSRLVAAAADDGDDRARQILTESASELVLLVDAVRDRLGTADGVTLPVSYSGGLFRARRVREAFVAELAARSGAYVVQEPRYEPVVGAALYAAVLAGTPLDAAACQRLDGAARQRLDGAS